METIQDNMVTIPVLISAEDLWSNVFGSAWEMNEWWSTHKFIEGDWDVPGKIQITADNPIDENPITKVLTIDDIVTGYTMAVLGKHYHCGGYVDVQDLDMCAGDIIVQCAMFGDVYYG